MQDILEAPLVIGYVGTRDLADMAREDIEALDGINIAFGTVDDGDVVWKGADASVREALRRIREINPKLKQVLSIGGWGAGGFSEAAATEAGRRRFAETAVSLAKDYGLDGLDIDWEYPTVPAAGIGASEEDRHTFPELLQSLRDALDELDAVDGKHRLLTIAAGAGDYFCQNTDMAHVAEILDYVQIMTYDMANGYGHITGHHTNLYQPADAQFTSSAAQSVRDFVEHGVPKDKIVIGAAFYSHQFRGVKDAGPHGNGYLAESEEAGTHGPVYDELVAHYIDKNGYTRYWDDTAKAPWLFNGDHFITYDDPESIEHKVAYLKREGLLGIMYWEYGCAKTYSLTRVLRRALDEA